MERWLLKDKDHYQVDTLDIQDESLLDTYCEKADFVFNLAGVNRPKEQSEFMDGNLGFASKLLDTLKSNCRSGSRDSCIAACDHKHRLSDPIGLYYQLWFDCRPWMCDRRRRTYFSGDCDQGRKSDSKSNKN